jgi:type VI secretion system secreted protein Hcp
MATDVFLKRDGILGESTDDAHRDWIELTGYHQEIKQPVSYTASSAGGASAERVNFAPFFVSKLVDKATPKIFEAVCTGKHIKEVVVEFFRANAGGKVKYLEIRMEQVLISDYVLQDGGQFASEDLSFVPGVFKMTYTQQKRSDGAASGKLAAGWSLIENKFVA